MDEIKKRLSLLGKFKYPLLVLLAGMLLMLLPLSPEKKEEAPAPEQRLEEILSSSRGVGEARVLLSPSGVIVVCRGADDASVRLDMIRAIRSYTGFGSDKITILKLAD
ncbi:MAG: hypothetical protein K6F56_09975 [Oscillospiraceae bacterium]|nr:hypothetical protein [Oscillospiraceae bacterium]